MTILIHLQVKFIWMMYMYMYDLERILETVFLLHTE